MTELDCSSTSEEEANMWAQLEKDPEFVKLQQKMEEEFKKLLDSEELPF